MSDNWVVQNLQNSLSTWNEKLAEVWQLLTQSPENFKGGKIWDVILNINGAVQAIGLALLVLFFLAGMVRTSASLTEVKKPEHALKLFIRFAIAKAVVTYGLELMLALFTIIQGVISTIMKSSGIGGVNKTVLPQKMIDAIEDCGFFESIPLWAVTLIGSLFIIVLSFIIILTVYGRFFNRFGEVTNNGMLNKAISRIIRDHNDEELARDSGHAKLIPKFSCHSLRHTFTTRMIEAGVNIKVVQEILGHTDVSTTLNIYADATKDLKRSEFAGLNDYLKKAKVA